MRRPQLWLALLVPLALGSECPEPTWRDNPAIRFLLPAEGDEVTWMPLAIELDRRVLTDPQTLEVRLNGEDITDRFAFEAPADGRVRATADFVWQPGLLVQGGYNVLEASIEQLPYHQRKLALRFFTTVGDPFADAVTSFAAGSEGGFNAGLLPGIVTGSPVGSGLFAGSTDVVSLGLGGSITVEFVDNAVVDGPGVDLSVFENAFLPLGAGLVTQPPFSEPGRVSVSQDGVAWHSFPCDLLQGSGPYHPGCAGVYPVLSNGGDATPHASIPSSVPIEDLVGVNGLLLPVPAGSGGDSFDLADLGLAWARYVRIEAATFVTGPPARAPPPSTSTRWPR
jgi:hypothetical protein